MTASVEALDAIYDQLVKGSACPAPTGTPLDADIKATLKLHKEMVERGDTGRPNNNLRYQAQIVLTSGRANHDSDDCAVLCVLSTAVYNRLLAFMMDPVDGLVGVRVDKIKSPLRLPPLMQNDDSMAVLNLIIESVHALTDGVPPAEQPFLSSRPFRLASAVTDDNWKAWLLRVHLQRAVLQLPAERKRVSVIRPRAGVGSLIIWTSWHGSKPALEEGKPAVSLFVDFAERRTWTAEQRRQSFALISERPWQFGAGSHLCRHAGYNNANNKQRDRRGGIAQLVESVPANSLFMRDIRYLSGDDASVVMPRPSALTDLQIEFLRENGYLVVPREQMLRRYPAWDAHIRQARAELTEHMNDVLGTRAETGEQLRKRKLDLSTDEGLDDARWEAVGGSLDAARRHFGDKHAFYRPGRQDARNGGSLITKTSGMGAATNLYDSPSALCLQIYCYTLFAQLYRTHELMMVPERFRVRTSEGALELHTDALVQYK